MAGHSSTILSSDDDRPLLIMVLSLGGAGAVLTVSTLFLCCYFYRTRTVRRNFSINLPSQIPASRARRLSSTATNDASGGGFVISNCNRPRPRSPVTTETDIYGFELRSNIQQQRRDGVNNQKYVGSGNRIDEIATESPVAFDNPLYNKYSETGSSGIDSPSIVIANGSRKSSSSKPSILPGLPSILVIDDSSSADDRKRLVPNDILSLEIEENQRWLRSCLELQEDMNESERKPMGTSRNQFDGAMEIRDISIGSAETSDTASTSSRLVSIPAKRKLHRRLAETIAKDRIMENTVIFTNETTSPPTSAISPTSETHFFPSNSNMNLVTIRRKSEAVIDGDLEIIFKERTAL